mmetsp:Transcript_42905/g.84629  ORF Transcript_42905/g.84629 Transcript_42905/m.84629 type:complete len:123 (-) Transcript_42905:128-496(-)
MPKLRDTWDVHRVLSKYDGNNQSSFLYHRQYPEAQVQPSLAQRMASLKMQRLANTRRTRAEMRRRGRFAAFGFMGYFGLAFTVAGLITYFWTADLGVDRAFSEMQYFSRMHDRRSQGGPPTV